MTRMPARKIINELLGAGVEEVIDRSSLEKKLLSGKKLTVKLGADPSGPDLHLGHAVVLKKMREFQALGHKAVFIIGDFTAMIGDPSAKSGGRKPLTGKEVNENAKTYLKQAGKVLDVASADVRRNSEWFSKMKLEEFIPIAGAFSLRRMMDREDFQKRIKKGGEIGLHEALYQILQAYDSVVVGADVELGGRDQKINLLAGRELQKKMGLPPQDIMLTPLLLGTGGNEKMSKSSGNYIALTDEPEEMFGKVMSVPDSLIVHYAELAAFLKGDDIKKIRSMLKMRPYEAKKFVAGKITELYWGKAGALSAAEVFTQRFAKKGRSEEAYEEKKLTSGKYSLLEAVMALGGAVSKAEGRRLILGRAVEYNHKVITDPAFRLNVGKEERYLRVGKKKFFKVTAE